MAADGNDSSGRDSDWPKVRNSATLPLKLLHATLAAMRCRQLAASKQADEARIQFLLLHIALEELGELALDDASLRELGALWMQERRLRRALASVEAPPESVADERSPSPSET
jgi:hypothetical protein